MPQETLAEATRAPDPLGMLLEELELPALAYDVSGTVLAINERAEELLGLKGSYIVGQAVELTNSLYVPLELRRLRSHTLLEERKPWRGHWAKVHQGGQEIPATVRVVPVPGLPAYLELIRPTEEAQSSAELERQLMSGLVQNSPVAMAVADFEGTVLYGNAAFEGLANRGKRLSSGTPLLRFFESKEYVRLFGEPGRAATPLSREPSQLVPAEGRARNVRVTANDVTDAENRLMFRLVAIEDAAELEGAREDAALLMEACRHVEEALLFSDPAGVLFFANDTATRLLGLSEDAVVGSRLATFLGEAAAAKLGEAQSEFRMTLKVGSGRRARAHRAVAFPVSGRDGKAVAWGWALAPAPRAKRRV